MVPPSASSTGDALTSDDRPILFHICPYNIDPPFTGGATRIRGIQTALSAHFRVITFAPRYSTIRPRGSGSSDPDLILCGQGKRIDQFVCLDLVSKALEAAQRHPPLAIMGASFVTSLHAAWIARRLRVPLIMDHFNVEHRRFSAMGRPILARVVKQVERAILRRSLCSLVVSAGDAAVLQELHPAAMIQIASNGFDPQRFCFDPGAGARTRDEYGFGTGEKVAAFVGKLDYFPNREAFWTIVEDIAPAFPEVRFVVAGPNPPDCHLPANVQILGPIPEIAPLIQAADLFIAPLWSGGGTKLKLVEAAACGKKIVTTPHGIEGLPTGITSQMHVASDHRTFREAVGDALTYADFESAISYDAVALSSLSWDGAAAGLKRVLANLTEEAKIP